MNLVVVICSDEKAYECGDKIQPMERWTEAWVIYTYGLYILRSPLSNWQFVALHAQYQRM